MNFYEHTLIARQDTSPSQIKQLQDKYSKIIENNNGNVSFNRNGSMNNLHNVEKTMLKFQQLAKDAQSNGDPVLAQNYLQHADHYLRRYNELSDKKESLADKTRNSENTHTDNTVSDKEISQNSN